VRKWQQTYRATGRDGLLKMGEKRSRYDFETKVAAARAVVDDGMCVLSTRFEQNGHQFLSSSPTRSGHAF
jgi:hypothetical protein